MLYMLGGVTFEVAPTNLDQAQRTRGFDWAAKPIVGAAKPREAMGAADATVALRGKLFPQMWGVGGLEALAAMAEAGAPQMLIRGDGQVLGWQCIEHIHETHSYLDPQGQGRVIEFDMAMVASPDGPGAAAMISLLEGLF